MKKSKGNKAITLIALIITVIVLLILAGVVISMTIGSNGIINKSQTAVETYEIEAIKEEIGRNLATMKMDKIIDGKQLTIPEDLLETAENGGIKTYNNKITEVTQNEGKALVTYDGRYVFEIDGDFNVKFVETTEGVSVTAQVSGGGGWVKSASESTVTVSGKITTTDGTIEKATITKNGGEAQDLTLEEDGTYTKTITESGTYTVYAKDSNGKEKTKQVTVEIQIDGTDPTVETINATVNKLKFTLSVTGHDKNTSGEEESGIDHFNYTITPPTNQTATPDSGELKIGQSVEITTSYDGTYTVSITATDRAGRTSTATTQTVTTAGDITANKVQSNFNTYKGHYVTGLGTGTQQFYVAGYGLDENNNKCIIIRDVAMYRKVSYSYTSWGAEMTGIEHWIEKGNCINLADANLMGYPTSKQWDCGDTLVKDLINWSPVSLPKTELMMACEDNAGVAYGAHPKASFGGFSATKAGKCVGMGGNATDYTYYASPIVKFDSAVYLTPTSETDSRGWVIYELKYPEA